MENKKKGNRKAVLLSFLAVALTIGALVGVTMIDTQNINYYNDIWAKNTIYTASMDIAQPTSKNPVMHTKSLGKSELQAMLHKPRMALHTYPT